MNPKLRPDWKKMFAELREWISAIPVVDETGDWAVCGGCNGKLVLLRGKRSGKFFWSHEGAAGCQGTRAIFFDTQQAALDAEKVFQ